MQGDTYSNKNMSYKFRWIKNNDYINSYKTRTLIMMG
jgi:hypothetical protein